MSSSAITSFVGTWIPSSDYFFSSSINEWRPGTLVGVRCAGSSDPRKVLLISSDAVNKSLMVAINREGGSGGSGGRSTTVTLVLDNLEASGFPGSLHKVIYQRAGPTVAIADRDYKVDASMEDGFVAVLVPSSTRTDPHVSTHARFSLFADGGGHRSLTGGWNPSASAGDASDLCATSSPVHIGHGPQGALDLFVRSASADPDPGTNSVPGESEEASKPANSTENQENQENQKNQKNQENQENQENQKNQENQSPGSWWGGDLLVWLIIGLTLLVYGSYLMSRTYNRNVTLPESK